jgi:hypothetical protein
MEAMVSSSTVVNNTDLNYEYGDRQCGHPSSMDREGEDGTISME